MDFHYDALSNLASKRLLKVLPTKENDLIQVEIWQESEDAPYRCLSYTWGEPTPMFPIRVNGRAMQVGKNLHEFLAISAERFANETLWIDAICINQNDNAEKAIQVQRMGSIYEEATEVFVWLGNDGGIARLFDATVSKPTWQHKVLYYVPSMRISRSLRVPVTKLLDHDYWKRAWVIQELALASSLRLLCGSSETTFDKLKTYTQQGSFANVLPQSSWYRWHVAFFCNRLRIVPLMIRRALRQPPAPHIYYLFRFIHEDPGIVSKRPPLSFWSLLDRQSLCQDPRDRVYSVLAITGSATTFEVRYNESVVEIFWRVAEHFSAWHNCYRIRSLGIALSIDLKTFEADFAGIEGMAMRCSIPMRSGEVTNHPGKRFKRKFCDLEPTFEARLGSRRFRREVLLCPYVDEKTSGFHSDVIHFLISPKTDGSEGFALYACIFWVHRRVPLSQNSELWSIGEEVSERVITWKEALRIAALGDSTDQDQETKPNLTLKTNRYYVVPFIDYDD